MLLISSIWGVEVVRVEEKNCLLCSRLAPLWTASKMFLIINKILQSFDTLRETKALRYDHIHPVISMPKTDNDN